MAGIAIFPNFSAEQRSRGLTDFNDLATQNPELVSQQLTSTKVLKPGSSPILGQSGARRIQTSCIAIDQYVETAPGPFQSCSQSCWRSHRSGSYIVNLPLVVVCAISFYKLIKQQAFRQSGRQTKHAGKLVISQRTRVTSQLDLRLENIARSVIPHLESLLTADSLHHMVFWKNIADDALEAFRAADLK